jgi:predicted amidohydrolase
MPETWTVAGVQTGCAFGDTAANTALVARKLAAAADRGANLVVFPECVVTGYGFESREHVRRVAQPLPGPATDAVANECGRRGVWCVFGLIEAAPDGKLFNACALVGPGGFVASYRKTHLPCLGADRFTDPGDRPFAVHDLGGLRLGLSICFDGSFPEVSRVLTVLGADLIVLPTNWATNARKMAEIVSAARAWENHVYYLAVNRVGDEAGFTYIGRSSAADYLGNELHRAGEGTEETFTIEVNPAAARQKRVVHCHGVYEIDRVNWRRPELYGPLVESPGAFTGHFNR